MFQVRFHGRGDQGVVTAADLLSVAAFIEGHYSQAIPSFGSERMGAPVGASVVLAPGEPADLSLLDCLPGVVTEDGTVRVGTGQVTGNPTVLAGEDIVTGDHTVTTAECPCGAIDMVPEET